MDREATESSVITQNESPVQGFIDRVPYWIRWGTIPALITAVILVFGWEDGREFPIDYGREIGLRIDHIIDWMNVNLDFIFSFIKDMLLRALVWLEDVMIWIPWPAFIIGVGVLGGAWQVYAWACSRLHRF